MDVLIVGAGTMGRWFGDVVDGSVAFADVDEDAATRAAEHAGGRVASIEASTDEESFDVVCIAVPMNHVAETIATQAGRADGAIVDVTGVMRPALEAMATHAPERERLSLHPLFAPDRAPGSIAVVRAAGGPLTDAVLAALEGAGNDLVETTAAEHDAAMESVQAAAHASVLAFALAADRVPEGFETPIYAQLRGLAERMSAGNPRVYADIQAEFAGADTVAAAADRVAEAGPEEIESLVQEAAADWRPAEDSTSDGESGERR